MVISFRLQNRNRHFEVSNRTASLVCNKKPKHILSSSSNSLVIATEVAFAQAQESDSGSAISQPSEGVE